MNDEQTNFTRMTFVSAVVGALVLAALVFLLLPTIRMSRDAARRGKCSDNLKQYGIALHNYHTVHKVFPRGNPASVVGHLESPGTGWQVAILPHAEHQELYDQIDFIRRSNDGRQAYYSVISKPGEPGAKACSHHTSYSLCPLDSSVSTRIGRDGEAWAHASYGGSIGAQLTTGGSFACERWVTPGQDIDERGTANLAFAQVPHPQGVEPVNQISGMFGRFQPFDVNMDDLRAKGASHTIGVGEVLSDCGYNRDRGWWHWDSGQNAATGTATPLNTMTTCAKDRDDCLRRRYFACKQDCWREGEFNFEMGFRSNHRIGAAFCLMDGSTQFYYDTMDKRVYRWLGTRHALPSHNQEEMLKLLK